MFTTITLRNVGTAAIVVGLLIALFTLSTTTDRPLNLFQPEPRDAHAPRPTLRSVGPQGEVEKGPFMLAWLLVVVGTGLRLEAAIRARSTRHDSAGR